MRSGRPEVAQESALSSALESCLPGSGGAADACFCITLDRQELHDRMTRELGAAVADETLAQRWPHVFANYPVFVPAAALQRMAAVIAAIERVIALPAWRAECLTSAPEIARHPPQGARSVFLGYDFHLDDDSLGLIEINTNAGGALINTLLARAQHACCRAIGSMQPSDQDAAAFEQRIVEMFRQEWSASRPDRPLGCIAIVDQEPTAQYLYPEFLLFRSLFERNGIRVVIADPGELAFTHGRLRCGDEAVDLVYNRLTDFYLEEPAAQALRQAYLADAVVVTPHPQAHALYADKRRLVMLTDAAALERLGVPAEDRALLLAAIPRTVAVTPENAEELWAQRRRLFFKPAAGYGGRAAYRGEKLTRKVWGDILAGDYVAQALVMPGVRRTAQDAPDAALKFDLRNYVYSAEVQWVAARLYQGQTTNFRTAGGGFAPVYTLAEGSSSDSAGRQYASYVFLLGASGVQPIPHALYVALARAEASSAQLAGRSFRLADWHVRLEDGKPAEVVGEWYGWIRFDAAGRYEPAAGPALANNKGELAEAANIDTSALPGPAEREAMHAAVFGTPAH